MAERRPTTTIKEEVAVPLRDRLVLALDLSELEAARALARRLHEHFAVVKVGLELFSSAGPAAVTALRNDGFVVFVDLKLHDIPTTVGRAGAALGRLGASYVTVHTAGGGAMLEAAVEGLVAGAGEVGAGIPMALGVTVLTSQPAEAAAIAERAVLAADSGCGGVVCAATDLAVVRRAAPGLRCVVPGIRLPASAHDDQARVATPAEALAAGADLLVVGRTVTAAADPERAAADLVASVDTAR